MGYGLHQGAGNFWCSCRGHHVLKSVMFSFVYIRSIPRCTPKAMHSALKISTIFTLCVYVRNSSAFWWLWHLTFWCKLSPEASRRMYSSLYVCYQCLKTQKQDEASSSIYFIFSVSVCVYIHIYIYIFLTMISLTFNWSTNWSPEAT